LGEGPSKSKWLSYGDCHKSPHIVCTPGGYDAGRSVVLVEDIVSAHKVGQIAPCIPLFGTKVFSSVIPCLRHLNLPIVFWLDKDQEGMMPKRAASLAMVTGLPCSYKVTNDDPKAQSLDKIREICYD
jgi:hypothetical protein